MRQQPRVAFGTMHCYPKGSIASCQGMQEGVSDMPDFVVAERIGVVASIISCLLSLWVSKKHNPNAAAAAFGCVLAISLWIWTSSQAYNTVPTQGINLAARGATLGGPTPAYEPIESVATDVTEPSLPRQPHAKVDFCTDPNQQGLRPNETLNVGLGGTTPQSTPTQDVTTPAFDATSQDLISTGMPQKTPPPPKWVKSVVRIDPKTGRLIRSTIVSPKTPNGD